MPLSRALMVAGILQALANFTFSWLAGSASTTRRCARDLDGEFHQPSARSCSSPICRRLHEPAIPRRNSPCSPSLRSAHRACVTGFVAAAGWIVFFMLCAAPPSRLLLWSEGALRDRAEREARRGVRRPGSDLAAVIGPMQQRLALPGRQKRPPLAIALDLPDVPAHRLPALDLPPVLLRHAAPEIIAAIPLEPAARIIGMKPAFVAPDRSGWLASTPKKLSEQSRCSGQAWRQQTSLRETLARIGHVLAAEHAEPQHLAGVIRLELRIEMRPVGAVSS